MMSAKAEDVLRSTAQNLFGGYKFAAQNAPNFVRLAGGHPVLANAPAEFYRQSDVYNLTHGLEGPQYHGMVPLGRNPLNGDLIEMNPLGMSSMADLIGAATKPDTGDATGLGDLSRLAGEVGLGTNPIIKTGLQLTGQMGNDQMSDVVAPLTALSGAVSIARGVPTNLEQGVHDLVAGGEQALTGRETFPYMDYLLRKRQAELGRNGNKWNAAITSGPIHDAAVLDTAHRIGTNDLLRTLTPFDIEMTSPEAQAIGQNQYLQNIYASRGMTGMASWNPTAHAYEMADPLAEKVARFATLPIMEQQALLRDPRALEMLTRQRSMQIHNPQALAVG